MFVCYSRQEYDADEKLLDIVIESGYVCATSTQFDVLREVQMRRCLRVHSIRQIERVPRSCRTEAGLRRGFRHL